MTAINAGTKWPIRVVCGSQMFAQLVRKTILYFMDACFFLNSWYLMTPNSSGVNELINLSGCPHHKKRVWASSLKNCPHHHCHINHWAVQCFQMEPAFSTSFIQTGGDGLLMNSTRSLFGNFLKIQI